MAVGQREDGAARVDLAHCAEGQRARRQLGRLEPRRQRRRGAAQPRAEGADSLIAVLVLLLILREEGVLARTSGHLTALERAERRAAAARKGRLLVLHPVGNGLRRRLWRGRLLLRIRPLVRLCRLRRLGRLGLGLVGDGGVACRFTRAGTSLPVRGAAVALVALAPLRGVRDVTRELDQHREALARRRLARRVTRSGGGAWRLRFRRLRRLLCLHRLDRRSLLRSTLRRVDEAARWRLHR
mmetsp:Transcript_19067/g.61411  ORF Transcript_19067/g.61411 Transcript_19067/m.61411 type:complete len:241 (-) Transcript_19067:381-1103(-)